MDQGKAMARELNLTSEVRKNYDRAHRGARNWSTAYHVSGVLSIVASAASAFIAAANLNELSGVQAAWIAALSGAAAALTTTSTFAGFQRKWRANRETRTGLYELLLRLPKEGETPALLQKFCKIMEDHDRAISGAETG